MRTMCIIRVDHCQCNRPDQQMTNNNLSPFRQQLNDKSLCAWLDKIAPEIDHRIQPERQRNFPGWLAALDAIPQHLQSTVTLHTDTITTQSDAGEAPPDIVNALLQLRPWRKGPFTLNGVNIDTEWRSNWKWRRIAPHLNLQGLNILDVGCGNGYYSLRMLGAGANRVIGLDTSLLYWAQFQAITRFTNDHRATVLPLGVECLEESPCEFDAIFSMGVLYHRRQPLDHLKLLLQNLRKDGLFVLETLILHGHRATELIPEDRYANMRNVWSVPALPSLMSQMKAAGFRHIRCVDVTRTTVAEQRKTDWMTFNSLADALDESNPRLTREGHPGPVRAVVIAQK